MERSRGERARRNRRWRLKIGRYVTEKLGANRAVLALSLARLGDGFGIAFSALIASRVVFQIPLGHLSDWIGRRPVILAGLFALAPATAAIGLSATTEQLVVYRLLQGVASAAVAAPAFAIAADLSSRGGEGRQLGVLTMGFGLGIALGPLLAGLLGVVSFELPFLAVAALTLGAAAVVWAKVPETVPEV